MIQLFVGPGDRINKRAVVAKLNGTELVDSFNTDELGQRVRFAKLAKMRFSLADADEIAIPDRLLALADGEDAVAEVAPSIEKFCVGELCAKYQT